MTHETERLVLREFRPEDFEDVHAYSSDYETVKHMMFGPNTPEQTRDYLERQCPEERDAVPRMHWNLALERREDGRVLGGISFHLNWRRDDAMLEAILNHHYGGHGYMTEAVREVLRHAFLVENLAAVRAGYYEGNEGSRRVQEKAGLRPHHHVDGAVDRLGITHTEHVQRITRKEWEVSLAADPTDAGTIARQQSEAAGIIDSLPLISLVRSGGQTGADRGGLDAAREQNVPICGWCPPGGLAEDLPEPPGLLAMYPELREGPSQGYVERTAWNVRDSHATLIVSPGGLEPRSGTEMTAIFAEHMGRPVLVLERANVSEDATEALAWLRSLGTCAMTLNVAGPRESKMPGVYELTHDIVTSVLRQA